VPDKENKGYIGRASGDCGRNGKRRRSRTGGGWEKRDGGAEWTDVTESSPLEHREESTAYFMGSFSGHIVVLFPII